MQEFSRGKYDSLHPTEAKFVLVQIAPYLFLEKKHSISVQKEKQNLRLQRWHELWSGSVQQTNAV